MYGIFTNVGKRTSHIGATDCCVGIFSFPVLKAPRNLRKLESSTGRIFQDSIWANKNVTKPPVGRGHPLNGILSEFPPKMPEAFRFRSYSLSNLARYDVICRFLCSDISPSGSRAPRV